MNSFPLEIQGRHSKKGNLDKTLDTNSSYLGVSRDDIDPRQSIEMNIFSTEKGKPDRRKFGPTESEAPEFEPVNFEELNKIIEPLKKKPTTWLDLERIGPRKKQIFNEGMTEQRIEYSKIRDYIDIMHPTVKVEGKEEEQPFGLFDTLGRFQICPCLKKERNITEMASQIGIGPTVFLLTTRSLIWLFVILSILNAPVLYFLYSGNYPVEGLNQAETSIFIKFSLGNLQQPDLSCTSFQPFNSSADTSSLKLQCGSGSKIGSNFIVGLGSDDQKDCSSMTSFPKNL